MFGMDHDGVASPAESVVPPVEKKEKRVEARKMPPFEVGSCTEASPKHPEVNQDAFVVDAKRQLLMVADGVGGSARGELASRAAQEAMGLYDIYLDELIDQKCQATGLSYLTVEQASQVMDEHFSLIANYVYEVTTERATSEVLGAATTLTTAKVFETAPGERYAVVKSIGDSYPMVRRANGVVEMIDIDEDSVVREWVKKGEVSEDELFLISESGSLDELEQMYTTYMSEQELEVDADRLNALKEKFNSYFSPSTFNKSTKQARSEVTQFVGKHRADRLTIHSAIVKLEPGDQLYLSTDGIDPLRRRTIQEVLSQEGSVADKSKALVEAATSANTTEAIRAKPDDITVVGMEVPLDAGDAQRVRQEIRLAEAARIQKEDVLRAEAARQRAFERAKMRSV